LHLLLFALVAFVIHHSIKYSLAARQLMAVMCSNSLPGAVPRYRQFSAIANDSLE